MLILPALLLISAAEPPSPNFQLTCVVRVRAGAKQGRKIRTPLVWESAAVTTIAHAPFSDAGVDGGSFVLTDGGLDAGPNAAADAGTRKGGSDVTASPLCTVHGTLTVRSRTGEVFTPTVAEVFVKRGESSAPRRQTHVMYQQGKKFDPQVLVVERNDTVVFQNRDPFVHEVHCDKYSNTFPSERNERPETFRREFIEAGVSHLGCHVHAEMAAVIITVPNRFHARVGPDGRWSISGLSTRRVTLEFWESGGKSETREVFPCDGTSVDVEIKQAQPPSRAPYGASARTD